MQKKIRILMVEDLQSDVELIKRQIKKSGIQFIEHLVETKEDYIQAIHEFRPDIILSDFSLPNFNGLEALSLRGDLCPLTPFILVTGSINEETAVEIMKAGSDDYIIKEHITRIGNAIITALEKKEIIRAKKEAENEIRILSRAVDQNPASIIITNLQGDIEYVNPKFTQITGYTLAEVTGKNPRILKSDIKTPEEYKHLWDTIISGSEWHGEFQNRKKDGEVFFESALISPIKDENGKIINFLAVKEDITERKRAEEELAQKHTILKTQQEASLDAILVVDENEKILSYNSRFTEMMGIPQKIINALYDTPVLMYVMQQIADPDQFLQRVQYLYTHKKETSNEEIIFKDGRIVDRYSTPMFGNDDRYYGRVWYFRDITVRKRAEIELRAAKEKAEESDRLKTSFLHNITHEIRTPMNAIVGFSRLINDPNLHPDKRKHFSELIAQSSNQLLSIMTDIIDIATIESGQEKINEKVINLNSTLRIIYDQFLSKCMRPEVTLRYSNELNEQDAYISTDESKLFRILNNLIGNALKFTEKGFVEFGYTLKGKELEFYIKDSGIGIDPALFEKIFLRFRQVDNSATRQYGGSGLGLSISKAYIELLGGHIWLNSEPGQGSEFYFTLPYKGMTSNVLHDEEFIPNPKIENSKTILVAEDEDINFSLLEELLLDENIDIIRAINGIEAVKLCKSNPDIDLVLMDLKMPIMDGYIATKQIKMLRPDLPVIAQTAYSSEDEKAKALECGCSDFFTKPFIKDLIVYKIKKYLTKT